MPHAGSRASVPPEALESSRRAVEALEMDSDAHRSRAPRPVPTSTAPRPAAQDLPRSIAAARAITGPRRLDRTVAELDALRVAHPESPEPLRALGQLFVEVGQGAEAREAFALAARLAPEDPELLAGVAVAEVVAEDPETGRETARRAIRAAPDCALAHAALGMAQETLGEREAAVRSHARAVELDPVHQAPSAYRLSRLGAPVDRAALEATVAALPADLPDSIHRNLRFACSEAAVRAGDPARAFEHAAEGNRRTPTLYDPAIEAARAEHIVATFDAAFFAARRGAGFTGAAPVFLVGPPRSGTSLVEQILDAHPRLEGRGEDRWFGALVNRLGAGVGADPACFAHFGRLRPEVWEELGRGYAEGRALRTVDKAMSLLDALGAIACALPRARIVHVRRDRRDVALSNLMTNFGPLTCPHANEPAHTAFHLERHAALMAHWRRVLPLPILELDYEALVVDPEGQVRRLLEFLDEPFDPACLRFHESTRPVFTASVAQVRRPLYSSSVGRWRRYERELRAVLPADWFDADDGEPGAPGPAVDGPPSPFSSR